MGEIKIDIIFNNNYTFLYKSMVYNNFESLLNILKKNKKYIIVSDHNEDLFSKLYEDFYNEILLERYITNDKGCIYKKLSVK